MKPTWVYCEVFRRNIYFFHNWKRADYIEYVKKNYGVDIDVGAFTYGEVRELVDGTKSLIFVWTNKGKDALNILHHECIHVKNFIFEQHGVKLTTQTGHDEFEAYYSAMLFRKGRGK